MSSNPPLLAVSAESNPVEWHETQFSGKRDTPDAVDLPCECAGMMRGRPALGLVLVAEGTLGEGRIGTGDGSDSNVMGPGHLVFNDQFAGVGGDGCLLGKVCMLN